MKTMLTNMISNKHNYWLVDMDSPKSQDPSAEIPANKKAPPLECGHS